MFLEKKNHPNINIARPFTLATNIMDDLRGLGKANVITGIQLQQFDEHSSGYKQPKQFILCIILLCASYVIV